MKNVIMIVLMLIVFGNVAYAIAPSEVLVVYNTKVPVASTSQVIAEYYAGVRNIPLGNVIGLPMYVNELLDETRYVQEVATPIWNYLSTRPHIKCIVLCYGIPSRITYQSNYDMSVDSALALFGNPGVPDAQGQFVRHWGLNSTNPYCGKNTDFGKFRDSAENAVQVTVDGQTNIWKLNYLVTRLDAYSQSTVNVNGTAIPRDVKAMIDRSVAAQPDGCFVVDRSASEVTSVLNHFTGDLSSANIVTDSTDKFLTGENDVIGYWGEHLIYGHNANNYTTWTRPFHNWLPGGIAIYNTNDGHSYRSPKYTWWAMPGVTENTADEPDRVLAGHIKVINMYASSASFPRDQYDTHQVVLCDSNGNVIKHLDNSECRATFSRGVCTMDLSDIDWPADHKTSIELRFPVSDTLFPDGYIYESRSPHIADTTIYNARQSGITFDCNSPGLTRVVSSSYIAEGASGTISLLNHVGGSSFDNAGIAFSRYYAGYSWAESAYMAIPNLGTHYTVLGDPLMAPFAAKPTVFFLPPTPADGSNVRGQVALAADAEPDGTGSIDRVEFYVVGTNQNPKLVGTDNDAPYFTSWDTTENFADGEYTILAVAYQLNERFGATTTSVSVTLNNSSAPAVYINSPDADNLAVGQTTPVLASVSPSASRVQFWLYWDNTLVFCGEDDNAPYECIITPTTASDGIYKIQAIAYDDVTDTISYSVKRQLIVHNSGSFVQSVVDAADEPDETLIMLANVPVAAGTSTAMKRTPASTANAFYVEDVNRAAGLRIETSIADEVDAGRLLTIQGILHKGQSENERYLEASGIWDMGVTEPPKPLGMSNAFIGGKPPADAPGITGGVGLFNTGLLVTAWGKVTYVGDDYVYIDDGCGLQDGNTLQSSIVVPLDGSPIPTVHSSAKGVRVCFGSFEKPGIGDYVTITGASSVTKIGDNVVRLIRVRDQEDIVYAQSYQTCRKTQPYGRFVGLDSSTIPLGSKVRLVDTLVQANYGTHLNLLHTGITGIFSWVHAYTLLPTYQHLFKMVTVIGSSVGSSYGDEIVADCIYQGGSRFGALSLWDDGFNIDAPCAASSLNESENSERGGGPFRPWPSPAVADIISSVRFNTAYNRPGNIGWILSQSEGSVHDVQAVVVRGNWFDGRVLGLREWYEPIRHGPNLFLYLDAPIKLEANYREYATIDIIGAKLVTLSDGRRALVRPEAVYVYTDSKGGRIPPLPWLKTQKTTPISEQWMWKVKVAP